MFNSYVNVYQRVFQIFPLPFQGAGGSGTPSERVEVAGKPSGTPGGGISGAEIFDDMGMGQNPGNSGEPQNSWDLWM